MTLDTQIINRFLYSEEFCRKVLPFTKAEYFEDHIHSLVVETILEYFGQYNRLITKEILEIQLLNRKDLTHTDAAEIPKFIETLENIPTNEEWLIDSTEKFYQKRAVYLAILDSIGIIDGTDKKRSEDSIPSMLQEALAVGFDTNVGHDYFKSAEQRFEFYNTKEEGIQFDIELLNKLTDNVGMRPKTITALNSRSGGGKSIGLCHISASTLKQGKNVLYITMEMSEYSISQRIDANLMNVDMKSLKHMTKDTFMTKIDKIRDKVHGTLVVKEYPTGSAHAGHFRALIEELRQKKGFIPDLIVVDYLGICASQRVKNTAANSYTVLGSVAEELRALGQEYNVPVLTAVQVNRGAFDSTDLDMSDTSDSMKIVHSLDLYLGIIRTEELDELNQILIKVLKNRYGAMGGKFVIGVDLSKSQWYDVEQSAQSNISGSVASKATNVASDDTPVFDKSKFGKRLATDGFKF